MSLYDHLYDPGGIDYGKVRTLEGSPIGTGREQEVRDHLLQVIYQLNIPATARILEVGASMGYNHGCHPGYVGIEYSKVAVEIARRRFGADIGVVHGDVTCLEFDEGSFDLVCSFSTLEHVAEIEKAFENIVRVTREGGYGYLSVAWNCRPWTVEKIDVIPYRELPFSNKVAKALIPIRDNLLVRFIMAFPLRLWDEMRRLLGMSSRLRYRELQPRIDLIEKYGHHPDDDAFVSMDSHSAMMWFLDRGLELVSHRGILRRLFCRGEAILFRKAPPK